jgi:formate--tetrahydrofolate ligase
MIDNHIYWGNKLKLDPKSICWGRTTDISDRVLREIQVGLNIKKEGYPRNSTFCISSASEIMAILALFKDLEELRRMLSRIIIGYNKDGCPVYARQLKVVDSMLLLLKDAIKPNLVQTIEGNPVLVHTGPFANIAHGNSSLIATQIALGLSDYVITEGGFGADLGFEKFVHIVCRKAGFKISAVVLVVSIKALKYHGGKELAELKHKDIKAIEKGLENLERHVSNIRKFGFEPVLCINVFPQDKREEIEYLKKYCKEKLRLKVATSEAYKRGGKGAIELAEAVLEQIDESKPKIKYLYPLSASIEDKILKIATQVYGAEGVQYSEEAVEKLKKFRELGLRRLPINIARTRFSFTHDPKLRGAPSGWRLKVRDLCILNGAGFVVPVTGKLMLLPALPKVSLAERVKYKRGKFIGLD